jgi:hypothetical protein
MSMPAFWTSTFATTNTFNQYGGTNRFMQSVILANGPAGTISRYAEYNLYAGEQVFDGPDAKSVQLADKDRTNLVGIIRLSTATNQFVWKEEAGSGAVSMSLGRHAQSLATLRGWGDVEFTGDLQNNGIVVADGWATDQDRTLDLSTMASVANVYDNTGSNGWYAVNRGKLVLPALSVPAGGSTQRWGESSGDTTIDMVNSVEIGLTGVSAPGSLSLALLATNHSEVVGAIVNPIAVWHLSSDFTVSAADIRIRYDDAAAAAQGLAPADLKLLRVVNGRWRPLSASVDAGNKWITATGVSGLSMLAVAEDYIPSGTVITVR